MQCSVRQVRRIEIKACSDQLGGQLADLRMMRHGDNERVHHASKGQSGTMLCHFERGTKGIEHLQGN